MADEVSFTFNLAQWKSTYLKIEGFEPHQRHCIVPLSKTLILCLVMVQDRKTHPDMTEKMLTGT